MLTADKANLSSVYGHCIVGKECIVLLIVSAAPVRSVYPWAVALPTRLTTKAKLPNQASRVHQAKVREVSSLLQLPLTLS